MKAKVMMAVMLPQAMGLLDWKKREPPEVRFGVGPWLPGQQEVSLLLSEASELWHVSQQPSKTHVPGIKRGILVPKQQGSTPL